MPAAQADSLELGYGRRVALAVASFTIPAGQVTAVIGPNGSGKSTLLHAFAGILRPQRGRLHVPALAKRSGVAYVLQATKVTEQLPMTVREVVTLGRYARTGGFRRLRADDRKAIDVALGGLAITELAGRQLHELSGGQRQRVFVAQGLVQEADLLLLDEAVTGLDIVSQELILSAIDAERDAGRTVVLSTHNLGEAAKADHLLLLAGRLVASGPAEAVLTDDHLSAAYGERLLRLDNKTVVLDDGSHHAAS